MLRVLLLAALVVPLAGCTSAPDARPPAVRAELEAWPAWEVGDAWSWNVRQRATDGKVVEGVVSGEVVEVTDATYVVRSADSDGSAQDQTFWRSNMTVQGSKGPALEFPLRLGSTWSSGNLNARVVGVETVTTPAGTFEAWHVNYTSAKAPIRHWRDDWWSPEAKVWVKSRQVALANDGHVAVERELVDVRLASTA